jgi:hypothetical protein
MHSSRGLTPMDTKPHAMSLRFDTLFLALALTFVGIVLCGGF